MASPPKNLPIALIVGNFASGKFHLSFLPHYRTRHGRWERKDTTVTVGKSRARVIYQNFPVLPPRKSLVTAGGGTDCLEVIYPGKVESHCLTVNQGGELLLAEIVEIGGS